MNRADWWHLGIVLLLLFGWWALLLFPLAIIVNEMLEEAKHR